MTLVWAVLAGLLIGVILGALGGGGGILAIPVLTYLLGMPAQEATAASLVIVGLSAVVGMVMHARAGRVDWGRGLAFAAFGMLGAVAGSVLSAGLDSGWLLVGFGVLLLVVATLMLRPRPTIPDAVPADLRSPRTLALTSGAGLGAGLLTGFFGVGGGFAVVPALTLVLGLPMPAAVATSLLVLALNSAAGLGTKLAVGVSLDWPLVAAFTVGTMAGSVVGARLAGRTDPALLRRAFGWLLVVVALFTVGSSLISLL